MRGSVNLANLGHDQNAVVAGALRLFTLELSALSDFG